MTDRTISFLVTLDKEYRLDDAEYIAIAIKMIKGVLEVTPNITGEDKYMNEIAMKNQLREKFYNSFFEIFNKM